MKEQLIQNILALLPYCKDESLLDLIYKLLITAECSDDSSDAVVLFCG